MAARDDPWMQPSEDPWSSTQPDAAPPRVDSVPFAPEVASWSPSASVQGGDPATRWSEWMPTHMYKSKSNIWKSVQVLEKVDDVTSKVVLDTGVRARMPSRKLQSLDYDLLGCDCRDDFRSDSDDDSTSRVSSAKADAARSWWNTWSWTDHADAPWMHPQWQYDSWSTGWNDDKARYRGGREPQAPRSREAVRG